jgi:hypothetical protein
MVASWSTSAVAPGQPDLLDGPLTMSAYDEVVDVLARAAKWISSAEPCVGRVRGDGGEPFLEEVLDGLDVVLTVTRSMSAISAISAAPKCVTMARKASCSCR